MAGSTNESDFPTVNAIQAAPGSPLGASFVSKIDPTGQKLIYSTYLSGGINYPFIDAAYALAVDSTGAAWVGGFTGTVDFPLVDPVQPSTTGASGYVAKLSPSGNDLQFSSYLNIASFASGSLQISYEVLALAPASSQSVWLAASGGSLPSTFARLDLSPQVQTGVPSILSVYNAAGDQLGDYVSPGEIVSIFGNDLAIGTQSAAAYPLPQSLQGTTVTIGGATAPLYLVAPDHINLQAPTSLAPGVTTLVVNQSGQPAASRTVDVIATAAGIFTADGTGSAPLVVHASDFALVTAQNPAHAGEYLTVFCTGLGATTPTIPAGTAAPPAPVATQGNIELVLNSRLIIPTYTGLAPGFAGLYQIDFQVPAGDTPGIETLYAGGSNMVYFPVQ